MGIPKNPPTIMRWMRSLHDMKAANTRIIRTCASPCKYWKTEDLDELIALLGPEASLHDERPPCPQCDRVTRFMASPRKGTPFRPLLTGMGPEPRRPAEGWPEWPGDRRK